MLKNLLGRSIVHGITVAGRKVFRGPHRFFRKGRPRDAAVAGFCARPDTAAGLVHPRSRRANPLLRAGALSALAIFLLAGCSQPQPRRRSFVGTSQGARQEREFSAGLNPLGILRICKADPREPETMQRVLVSRPQFFTRQASAMILQLHEALTGGEGELPPVELVLSGRPLRTARAAEAEGRRCGAMVVLWERGGTNTLELTLPRREQIPLRGLVHRKLCEFGNHREQVTILYLTIMGLTASAQDNFEKASYYLTSATGMDARCLKMPPGVAPPQKPEKGPP